MKNTIIQISKTLIFLFVISVKSFVLAQAPSVSISDNGGGGYTLLEPTPASYGYACLVSNLPDGAKDFSYTWSATGSETLTNGTTANCIVNWKNTPDNTDSKSITITFKYKLSNGTNATALTATKTITVKHIGTIGYIALNGTTVSAGGTYSNLPCAISTITVSCPIPATYPNSSIKYYWSKPSGWTIPGGVTTTYTNSITLTTNQAGGGVISVTASRTDGTTYQQAQITVTRPQFTTPTVSNYGTSQGIYGVGVSDRVLCGTTTFQVTGGNGTSYSWQTTGGVSASSTTASATVSASSDGTVKVFPVSVCGTGTTYALVNIKTGTPGIPKFTADGDSNSFVNMCAGNSKYLVVNSNKANSYSFQLLNGTANLITSGSNSATFNTYNTGVFRVEARATNCNGYGSNTKYINVINCSSAFSVSPNPTSSTLTVAYDKETPIDLMPDNIKLLNGEMKEFYSADIKNKIKRKELIGTTIDIDVNKLPRGEYYLHISNENHPDKDKKIEKIRVLLQ